MTATKQTETILISKAKRMFCEKDENGEYINVMLNGFDDKGIGFKSETVKLYMDTPTEVTPEVARVAREYVKSCR